MDDSPSYDNTDKDSDSDLDSLYDAIKEHDDIRFATYRTAAKIRYVQRKGYLHHIDIWNVIEAFRENGLNTMEATTLVNRPRLETLLSTLYTSLNKRLPPGQNISVEKTASLMATWLLFSLCSDETNRLRVFSVKIALAVLSCGKLMDKLRYIFSQLADSNGQLMNGRFSHFLKEICKLPAAVGERRTYNLTDSSAEQIFPEETKVNVNDFLETMMSDPGPHCVSWLIVLHRITAAESNFHPVQCAGCRREGFQGLRYKSDSASYHLCQMCFWRGAMSEEHKDDVFKEYSAWKTPGKPSGLRRSIRCIPQPGSQRIPQFPPKPEHPLDLSNIIPASPLPSHNGFHSEPGSRHISPAVSGMDRLTLTRLGGGQPASSSSPQPDRRLSQFATLPQPRLPHHQSSQYRIRNDEHELIACYASHLAGQQNLDYLGLARGPGASVNQEEESTRRDKRGREGRERGQEKDSRRLVYELEKKNAEIMREIARLRQNRASVQDMERDPKVVTELAVLRQRKADLENRLQELQETRKDLMLELEELMKILRVQARVDETYRSGRMEEGYRAGMKEESIISKSYQSCKFSQATKHQNVSSKLRPVPMGVPGLGGGGGSSNNGGGYERTSPGGEGNRAATASSPDSTSVPASVNSLSE